MHFLNWNIRDILVPKSFGIAKKIRFSSFLPPPTVSFIAYVKVKALKSYDVTYLMALIYFKTPHY